MGEKEILSKIKKMAYDNANKKLEQERKIIEEKANQDIEKIEIILKYIKNRLVFKKIMIDTVN